MASPVEVLRRSLRGTAKRVFLSCGGADLARMLGGAPRWATILRYHSVSTAGDYRSPTIAVSPALFDAQMAYLARHYTVLSLDGLCRRLADNRLPRNPVAITFDDGYRDNVEVALPILLRHGLTATFFVTSDPVLGRAAFWTGWLHRAVATASPHLLQRAAGQIGGIDGAATPKAVFAALAHRIDIAAGAERAALFCELERSFPAMPPLSAPSDFMMDAADLRRLHHAGMTVGSHTVTHRVLAGIPRDEALAELVDSKAALEAALDGPVAHLAYPNGHVRANVDGQAVELARLAGYSTAGTSRRGVVTRESSLHDLPRQGVNDALGLHGFMFKLEEARFPLLLRSGR